MCDVESVLYLDSIGENEIFWDIFLLTSDQIKKCISLVKLLKLIFKKKKGGKNGNVKEPLISPILCSAHAVLNQKF